MSSLYRVVTEAIDDILEHGFDSQARVDQWLERIQLAIAQSHTSLEMLDADLRKRLLAVFARATKTSKLLEVHRGIGEFTLEQIRPKLRSLLDKRILASAQLIRLNREQAIAQTLRRFSGWATSIPIGGAERAKRSQIRKEMRRGIAGLPFTERRVAIDQGHKLAASINEVIAQDGGAIAFIWHHVDEGPPAYDARPDHVARDGKIFVLRDNWALKAGLMKLAGRKYYDQITAAAEEPFCRCWVEALYVLRDLPPDMLTQAGREALKSARAQVRSAERFGVIA